MSIVLETRSVTLSVTKIQFLDRKIYYKQAFDIYVIVLVWSHPETKTFNIGAHFCKVLTLFGIPISFCSTFCRINGEPNTVIRCKSSMHRWDSQLFQPRSKSSRNCSQYTRMPGNAGETRLNQPRAVKFPSSRQIDKKNWN